ncbi:hypothetical protein [uncultured Hymenobacter sp.]|uniref:hypothetical protein n=1 Tax=uncultured Hymenobacter sp. TaxID=170016 RepID=UPI0035C9D888
MSAAVFRALLLFSLLSCLLAGAVLAQAPAPRAKAGRLLRLGKKVPAAALSTPLPAAEDSPAVRQRVAEAVALAAGSKESEALAKFQEVLKDDPRHYFSLWQAAVLSVRIGQRYSDETRKAAYFEAGRAYADRALVLQPESAESNYAVALALFNQATLRTARGRLRAFRDLRSHVVLAAERRPDWADAWSLLGRWQYRVAHYSLPERLFSRLALGGVPAGAGIRRALASLEKAHQLDSTRLQFCYDLARAYRYQGRPGRAARLLRYAVKLPPATSDDLTTLRRCQQLLEPLERQLARRQRRRPAPAP